MSQGKTTQEGSQTWKIFTTQHKVTHKHTEQWHTSTEQWHTIESYKHRTATQRTVTHKHTEQWHTIESHKHRTATLIHRQVGGTATHFFMDRHSSSHINKDDTDSTRLPLPETLYFCCTQPHGRGTQPHGCGTQWTREVRSGKLFMPLGHLSGNLQKACYQRTHKK